MKLVKKKFMAIITEERNYRVLKESIRMMKGQRSGTDEVIKAQ